jgi:hypothetical protein
MNAFDILTKYIEYVNQAIARVENIAPIYVTLAANGDNVDTNISRDEVTREVPFVRADSTLSADLAIYYDIVAMVYNSVLVSLLESGSKNKLATIQVFTGMRDSAFAQMKWRAKVLLLANSRTSLN